VLHQRPNTFAQTCLLPLSFSLQSDGGPYIFGHVTTTTAGIQKLNPTACVLTTTDSIPIAVSEPPISGPTGDEALRGPRRQHPRGSWDSAITSPTAATLPANLTSQIRSWSQGQFLKKSRHTAKRFEISLHYTQVISIPGAGPIQCEIDG
jgi:hypothetical protein